MVDSATPGTESALPEIKLYDDDCEHSEVLDLAWPFFYNIRKPDLKPRPINCLMNLIKFGHKFSAQRILDEASEQVLAKL